MSQFYQGSDLRGTITAGNVPGMISSGDPLKCPICSGVFTNRVALEECVRKCRRKSFVCDLCPKRYYNKKDLKKHYTQAHGKPYQG